MVEVHRGRGIRGRDRGGNRRVILFFSVHEGDRCSRGRDGRRVNLLLEVVGGRCRRHRKGVAKGSRSSVYGGVRGNNSGDDGERAGRGD